MPRPAEPRHNAVRGWDRPPQRRPVRGRLGGVIGIGRIAACAASLTRPALFACAAAVTTGCGRAALTVDLGGGETMRFSRIEPAGIFVGVHEVTNGQYRRFRSGHDSGSYEGRTLNDDRQPVVAVSLEDARAFCRWLNSRAPTDRPGEFRLPTGPEWTALATCGGARAHPWGDDWPPTSGNYADASADAAFGWSGHAIAGYDDGAAATCAVQRSGRSSCGLYGVGGNVWEWTEQPARDGTWRVLRGWSWRYKDRDHLRVDYTDKHGAPWGKDNNVGFRVVFAPARAAMPTLDTSNPPREGSSPIRPPAASRPAI